MKKVIVADGDAAWRRLIGATLEKENRDVAEAADGPQALRAAREQHSDMLLLDVLLPNASGVAAGVEVCRALKADPATRDITILVLVGTAPLAQGPLAQQEQWSREQLTDAGADYYITKPFSPLELLELTEAALAS
jgi:two-component system phosphate regulon response regulator PhoB